MPILNVNLIYESLRELANKEIQERLWKSSGGEVSSFVEAIEGLFDDSGLDLALERTPEAITADARALFAKLEQEIRKVDTSSPPQALIEANQMETIRRIASELLALQKLVDEL